MLAKARDEGASVHGKGTSYLSKSLMTNDDPLSTRLVDTGH